MRHFKTFDDHDLDVLFLQLNEGHIDTFVDAVVSKIKSCANLDEATSLARRVLLKAYELKKSVVPALLSSILLFMPVNQILSGSKDMKADAKEFFEKIIKQRTEKKSKELFDARISHLAPDFYEKMSMRESSNDWTISNGLGYIGAYQIGALAMLQMYDKVKLPFLKKLKGNRRERVNQLIAKFDSISKNKSLTSKQRANRLSEIFPKQKQEDMMRALVKWNEHYFKKSKKKYVGKKINGILVTWSGMMAAAHLKGAKSLGIYLESDGDKIPHDGFGTTVEEYMKLFK